MGKMKLFCIPHAGASAYYYVPLKKCMPDVEFEFVELKGRGRRFLEGLYQSFEEAVDDVFEQIKDKCDGDYAIFGHSMGSWLAYELYHKLLENQKSLPKCMFFSSREAPNELMEKVDFDTMSSEELEFRIRELGGAEDLERVNEEIKSMFYETIKSDFKILNDYEYQESHEKIRCKVVVMAGSKERGLSYSKLTKWQELVEGSISYNSFNGGHFYMNTQWEKMASVMENYLEIE